MTYPAEARGRRRHGEDGHTAVPSADQTSASLEALSEEQKQLLDRLQVNEAGMTFTELQSALRCPADELRSAIDDLLARQLISELNTIIPSYCPRFPGVRLYAD